MVTIGDVLGIVAFFFGVGGTGWAMTVTMGLLFPEQTSRASTATKGAFVRGLIPFLIGLIGVFMLGGGPALKLVGWVLVLFTLTVASFGLAGLSRMAARRLTILHPEIGEYPAFLRGAGFIISASLLPIFGWFLFLPAAFITSLGAGWAGLARRETVVAEV